MEFYSLAPVQSRQDHGWGSHDASPVPALLGPYSGAFSQVKDSVTFLTGGCEFSRKESPMPGAYHSFLSSKVSHRPSSAPFPPRTPAAALAVMRVLSQLLPLQ